MSAGESRPSVVGTFLVATGPDSRQKLQDFIETLDVPDGRELMIGSYEKSEPGEQNERRGARTTSSTRPRSRVRTSTTPTSATTRRISSRPVVQLQFNGEGADPSAA